MRLILYIGSLVILLILAMTPTTITYVSASTPEFQVTPVVEEAKRDFTREELESLVEVSAAKYNVSADDMSRVIMCESSWQVDLQSQHTYSKGQVERNPHWGVEVGDQERSFGLVQIHLPVHDVSIEEANDPHFAIDFMAYWFSKGKQHWWTCF